MTGSSTRPLTYSPGISDSNPVFTKDGNTVLFLSTRGTKKQTVYQVPVQGGESDVSPLITFIQPISNLNVWTSGSKGFITFTTYTHEGCKDMQCSLEKERGLSKDHIIFNQLYVRHWDEFVIEKRYDHLFKQDIQLTNGKWTPVGKPRDLMANMKYNTPIPPFGGLGDYDISSTGKHVAFSAERVATNTSWSTGWETFLLDLETNELESFAPYTHARTQNPSFSPSGRYLSFLTMRRPGYEADKLQLAMYDMELKRGYVFNWNQSISNFHYGHNDSTILIETEIDGAIHFAIRETSNINVKQAYFGGSVTNVRHIPTTDTCASIISSFTSSQSIIIFKCAYNSTFSVQRNIKFPFPSDAKVSKEHKFHVIRGGLYVNAYFFLPINFDKSRKYPLVHLIHGGPQGAWNNAWSTRWNPQVWTNRGYAVLLVNPRGSTGYPQEYVDAVRGDWGGEPFKDLIAALNRTLELPYIDDHRVCAAGASYGGYMINWINGNYHGYKCLINHDGTFDSSSKYYSTDELFFQEWEFYGTPWTNKSSYDLFTPSKLVDKWKTPTLIIHGGKDYRVPLTEGLMTFTALQRRGIPSQLLYYPSENHWVLEPKNSIQWTQTSFDWAERWIGRGPTV